MVLTMLCFEIVTCLIASCTAFCLDESPYVLVTRIPVKVRLSLNFFAKTSSYYDFWPSSYSIRVQLIFSIEFIANLLQCRELFTYNLMLLFKTDMFDVFSCFKCDKRKIFNTSCCFVFVLD